MTVEVGAPARLGLLDRLAVAALLLQAAEIYRPLGLLIGVPSQQVNIAFIGFFAVYAMANGATLLRLLNRPLGQIWALVFLATAILLGMQAIAGIITLDRFVYWLGFSSVYAGIFAASAILFMKTGGDRLVSRFFMALIAATWFGFAVNAQSYAFIREVLIYTSNEIGNSLAFDRILGFYQHPNMAAFSITLALACLVTSRRFMESSTLLHAAVIAASVAGVVITGSRTSTLLIGVVVLWYLGAMFRTSGSGKTAIGRAIIAPALLFAIAIVSVGAVSAFLGRESSLYATMTSRLDSVPALISGDASNDPSILVRQETFDAYLDRFQEKPLLGYGPDYAGAEIDAGRLANVSQNSWLEWAVESGFVYPLLVAFAFWMTLRTARRLRAVDRWAWSRALLLIGLFVAASLSIVELLSLRTPVCVLGMLVGLTVARGYEAEATSAPDRGRSEPAGARSRASVSSRRR